MSEELTTLGTQLSAFYLINHPGFTKKLLSDGVKGSPDSFLKSWQWKIYYEWLYKTNFMAVRPFV